MADWAIISGVLNGYPHNPDIDSVLYDRPLPFRFIYSRAELAWKLDAQVLTGYPHIVYWDTTPPVPPENLPMFDSVSLSRVIGFVGVSEDLTVTANDVVDAKIDDTVAFKILDSSQNIKLQVTVTLSQAGSITSVQHTFPASGMDSLATGTYSVSVSISRGSDIGKEAAVTYTVKTKPYITVASVTPNQLQKPITTGQQLAIVYTITGDSSITAAQSSFTLAGFSATHSASGNILGAQTAYLQINDSIAAGYYTMSVNSTLTVTGYGALQITLTTGNVLEITAAPTLNPDFTGLALSNTGRYVGNEIAIQVTVSGLSNILAGDSMTVSMTQGITVIYTNTEALTAGAYYYTHTISQNVFIGLSVGVYTVSAQITRGSFNVQKQTQYTVVGLPTLALTNVSPNIVHLPITAPFSLTSTWQVSGTGVDTIAGTVTLSNTGFGVSVNTSQIGFNAVIPNIIGLAVGNYALDSTLTATSNEYGSVNLYGTFPNALSVLPELPPTPDIPKDLRAGDIYLYNGFELTAIIKSYISFKWVRRYNKVGEFVFQLEKTRANIDLLATGNIVAKEGDDEAGFIENITISEQIEVSGRFVSSLLDYRIVSFSSDTKVSLKDTVNQIIQNNFISGMAASDRAIPELAIEYYTINDQQIPVSIDNNTLTPWFEGQRIGFKVRFDPVGQKFWFKLYDGTNSDAVFMENYRNIAEEQYYLETTDYKNVVYVRSGSGDTGQTVSFGSAQGLSRREGYLTAGSYVAADIGPRFLEDNGPKETLDIKIIDPYTPFEYKKDYDVGDVVKVISTQYAVEITEHILEITEYFDLTGFHLYIVFGDLPRTILTEIKDNSRNVDNIMNSRNDWLDSVMPDIADQVLDEVLDNLPDLPIGEDLENLIDEKILDTLTDMPEPVEDAITDLIESVTPDIVQNALNDMGVGAHIIIDHLPTQTEINGFKEDSIVLVYDPNDPFVPEA